MGAALLHAGVELYELRADAALPSDHEPLARTLRPLGLHAKCRVIDRERALVGSLNLDPRSEFINTEMGMLVDNPPLRCGAGRAGDGPD